MSRHDRACQTPKTPDEKARAHTGDSEYFHVMRGELKLEIEDTEVTAGKDQWLETEPGKKHKTVSLSWERNTSS